MCTSENIPYKIIFLRNSLLNISSSTRIYLTQILLGEIILYGMFSLPLK